MSASVRPVVRHADSPGQQICRFKHEFHDNVFFCLEEDMTKTFFLLLRDGQPYVLPPKLFGVRMSCGASRSTLVKLCFLRKFEKLDAASPRLFFDALESLLLGDCPTIRRSRRQRRASSCRFGLSRPCGIFPYRLKQGTAPERKDTEKNEKRKDQRRRTPEKTEGGKERGGDSAKEGKRRRRRERREGEKGGVKEGEKEGERWKERERRKERPSTEFRLQKAMLLAGWRDLHGRTVGTKADNLCCVVESIRNR
ncbi:hypothetical protein TGVEG_290645 [Toxoplasma gondii VEG]|uniref:Uncharacterized protein n=2 Tax=Toxoplasma gondii TaxID=5811 RepID=V4ZJD2_TOXGV|nr:hypothetical protein TGVEG_290645 [Toxoplasma gondii VEG]KFG27853.1 hypothetical protein TGP89_290645 [Toxoplasma gondii p89]